MTQKTTSCYVTVDQYSAYIPVAATVMNLADIFQKCAILPCKHPEQIAKSPLYSHLQSKSFTECISLAIPFYGNLWAIAKRCKARNFDDLEYVLRAAKKDEEYAMASVSDRLKDDAFFMTRLINQQGYEVMKYASDRLKKDQSFVLTIMQNGHCFAIKYIDETLQDDEEVFEAMLNYGQGNIAVCFPLVSARLRKEERVALAVVSKSPAAFQYVDATLQDSEKVLFAALKQFKEFHLFPYPVLKYASPRLQDSEKVVSAFLELDKIYLDNTPPLAVMEKTGFARSELEWASPRLKDDEAFVRSVIEKNGFAIRYASERIQNLEEVVRLAHQSIEKSHQVSLMNSKDFAPLCKLNIQFNHGRSGYVDYSLYDT